MSENWNARCLRLGGREKANELLAKKLRAFADQVESGHYPIVMSADFVESDKICDGDEITETISVTLSKPWGC